MLTFYPSHIQQCDDDDIPQQRTSIPAIWFDVPWIHRFCKSSATIADCNTEFPADLRRSLGGYSFLLAKCSKNSPQICFPFSLLAFYVLLSNQRAKKKFSFYCKTRTRGRRWGEKWKKARDCYRSIGMWIVCAWKKRMKLVKTELDGQLDISHAINSSEKNKWCNQSATFRLHFTWCKINKFPNIGPVISFRFYKILMPNFNLGYDLYYIAHLSCSWLSLA